MTTPVCLVDVCERPAKTRGCCQMHYFRLLKHGDPLGGRTPPGEAAAFFEVGVVLDTDLCIIWPYSTEYDGYGKFQANKKKVKVHIAACARAHGPRPPGLVVRHLCNNPPCFNGRHLRWGTRKENSEDMILNGTTPAGERAPWAKLTWAIVDEIRRRLSRGETIADLAVEFNVVYGTVWHVARGSTWLRPGI